jgi:arabinan endo-1,5-alpha-L-arabinosidase
MKSALPAFAAFALLALPSLALALDGQPGIHDPSTVTLSAGKYYTWGTGGSPLVSDDGWTWRAGVRPLHTGAAPDVIHIGDRYYMYSTQGRPGSASSSDIVMAWTKTLDPNSPDYKWNEGGTVASSDGVEDCNAIDPGLLLDPTTGRLWLVYGSYIGYIRLVELDPKTGKRFGPRTIKDPKTGKVTTNPDKPIDLAINCEASDLIYHDGWYYLIATHGSCCRGADSGYNMRMGRSRKVTGPYIDNMGVDMIKGGGKQFLGSGGRFVGPGHFGMMNLGEGVFKFTLHWEADLDRGGASVLDIRPLLFKDGWPLPGENLKDGVYEIQSPRNGNALELAVEPVPVGGARGGRGGGMPAGAGRGGAAATAPGAGRGAAPASAPTQAPPAGGRAQGAPADAAAAGRGAAPAGAQGAGRGGAGGGGMFGGTGGGPIANQDVAEVSKNWPAGPQDVRLSNYMCQAQQKWSITSAGAGGYPGAPYVKIQVAGTDRTLAATPESELVVAPAFTGAPEQLWRVEQVAENEWRIVPKSVSNAKDTMALTAIGSGSASLEKYDPASDKQRWTIKQP